MHLLLDSVAYMIVRILLADQTAYDGPRRVEAGVEVNAVEVEMVIYSLELSGLFW